MSSQQASMLSSKGMGMGAYTLKRGSRQSTILSTTVAKDLLFTLGHASFQGPVSLLSFP